MKPWTYDDYKSAVNNNIDFGVAKRGYSEGEAVGFAHSELSLRLEEFPSEISLALVALAACGIERGGFEEYKRNDFFAAELRDAVNSQNTQEALKLLPFEQTNNFMNDVEMIKVELNNL